MVKEIEESQHKSALKSQEIPQLEHGVRYITAETMLSDAAMLDRMEGPSGQQGMTGPVATPEDNIDFARRHAEGAIDPSDKSILYPIPNRKNGMCGYVQTYESNPSDTVVFHEFSLQLGIPVDTVRAREISMFRWGGVSDEKMVTALHDIQRVETERFANAKETPDGLLFVAFELPADASRKRVLEKAGFKNMGKAICDNESEQGDPDGTIEYDVLVWHPSIG